MGSPKKKLKITQCEKATKEILNVGLKLTIIVPIGSPDLIFVDL